MYVFVTRGISCCGAVSSFLSSAGVCLLVLGYTLLGALTFMTLEGHGVSESLRSHEQLGQDKLRSQTVEKLWSITEDLNILYKDNWTRLAEQEVLKFQDSLVRKYRGAPKGKQSSHIWSFPSSFLYSLTLITTIGKCIRNKQIILTFWRLGGWISVKLRADTQ